MLKIASYKIYHAIAEIWSMKCILWKSSGINKYGLYIIVQTYKLNLHIWTTNFLYEINSCTCTDEN